MKDLGNKAEQHAFSVEMRSKKYVKHISLSDKGSEHVLLEGFLGQLKDISLIENIMLEINGANGVLRIDITKDELNRLQSEGHTRRKKQL